MPRAGPAKGRSSADTCGRPTTGGPAAADLSASSRRRVDGRSGCWLPSPPAAAAADWFTPSKAAARSLGAVPGADNLPGHPNSHRRHHGRPRSASSRATRGVLLTRRHAGADRNGKPQCKDPTVQSGMVIPPLQHASLMDRPMCIWSTAHARPCDPRWRATSRRGGDPIVRPRPDPASSSVNIRLRRRPSGLADARDRSRGARRSGSHARGGPFQDLRESSVSRNAGRSPALRAELLNQQCPETIS